MPDIQSSPDTRQIPIDKVGVKGLRYPIRVKDRQKGYQHTVGLFDLFVSLPHLFKGTHMSRFIEVLNEFRGEISMEKFQEILEKTKGKLQAQSAHMNVEFPYFIDKMAPVTGTPGLMSYTCFMRGALADRFDLIVGVEVPVTTVCPCSKEISEYGAHNQRGLVRVQLRFKKFFWIEEIIEIVESSVSSEVYSLLKRPDEKFVTEKAYDNPMFVEDVVRSALSRLREKNNFPWYRIEAETFESIHNHSAYALIEKDFSPEPDCFQGVTPTRFNGSL
ncbi:MAG: GTP cyclohydrolase I FolE2 [Desulfomonile tiedjei]|nr:GTP cyclohydrolase I FolE2 [Desulfomonile tiedjei]